MRRQRLGGKQRIQDWKGAVAGLTPMMANLLTKRLKRPS